MNTSQVLKLQFIADTHTHTHTSLHCTFYAHLDKAKCILGNENFSTSSVSGVQRP